VTGQGPEVDRNSRSTDLLSLVFARPAEALSRAQAVLAGSPTPYDASIAHQTIGLIEREFGELAVAIRRLRRALELARVAASVDREADVSASLGIALIRAGRTTHGLATLDRALALSRGVPAARIRFRRGAALWFLGRHAEAVHDARLAVRVLRRAGDGIWTARALSLRAVTRLALGEIDRADDDLRAAQRLFDAAGQDHDVAVTLHNRGLVSFRAGDLPAALARLDVAERRYRVLGTPMPDLVIDRCLVLLAAGMPHDALSQADAATVHVRHLPGQPTRRAELMLVAARAALSSGDPATAAARAGHAARLFAAQRRDWWHAHARACLLHARFADGTASRRLLTQVAGLADLLAELGSPDTAPVRLLAGRVALAVGDTTAAGHHLALAARVRHHGPALSRVDGWLAHALHADAGGDTRRVLHACRRGLDVLDEHRLTLGASELRARATAQGVELAELAQLVGLRAGRPRQLLQWSERLRATVCAVAPVRPPDDRGARAELAAWRELTSRLDQARAAAGPAAAGSSAALSRDRRRLERRIRARTLRVRGRRQRSTPLGGGLAVGRLLDELGERLLLEIVDLAGTVHVLVCGDGRVRRIPVGPSGEVPGRVAAARWALRRIAIGAVSGTPDHLHARLDALGRQLERALLGTAVHHLGDRPVVIVPPARLHAVPWSLLPSLADREHSVAPSAGSWLHALAVPAPHRHRVVLVRGPNLVTDGAEVPAIAPLYRDVHLLQHGTATAAAVLAALDGCSLAHIAAHGSFRADSPLFSAIHLDDGPLTAYDLEQLHRAPHRIILPICDSGRLQPVGADELLGLSTVLLPRGTAGIVASVVLVNDVATVPLMRALHHCLSAGATLAHALLTARRAGTDDPVHRATGSSFVALGAG
jgi:hypothetical protein